MRRWALVALLVPTIVVSGRADAYVRTTSDRSNLAVQWLERCIIVRPDLRGSQDLPIEMVQAAPARSGLNWGGRTSSCSYLLLQSAPPLRASEVGIDGRPTVIFRDSDWQRPNKMHRDE